MPTRRQFLKGAKNVAVSTSPDGLNIFQEPHDYQG